MAGGRGDRSAPCTGGRATIGPRIARGLLAVLAGLVVGRGDGALAQGAGDARPAAAAEAPASDAAPADALPLAGPFVRESGHAFTVAAPAGWPSDDLSGDASTLQLLEDGRPLGPAHAVHDEIRRLGRGRYSHWGGVLYFATSDDSDPNTNGRAYHVTPGPPARLGAALWQPLSGGDPLARVPASALAASPSVQPLRDDAPPIVWIHVIDALRADTPWRQLPDGPLMPALSALAAESVVFGDAYSSSSFTKTSTASLFTGLWPQRHGVLHGVLPVHPDGVQLLFDLDRRFTTLAGWFAAHGYATATHPFTVHVRAGDGMLAGWQRLDLAAGRRVALPELPPRLLAYEHVLGVHGPYDPSDAARARLGLPARLAAPPAGGADPASTDWFEGPLSDADVERLRAHYHAEAVDADRALAERIAWLRETGLWPRTLLVVTADHGEAFLEHGSTQHSVQLHEEAVRVPLLVRFPERHPLAAHHGRSIDARVRLVDLFPTLAEVLTGAPPGLPYALDGKSLLPLLAGAEDGPRDVLFRASFTREGPGGGPALFVSEAALSGHVKAHVGFRLQDSQDAARFPHRLGDWIAELYDLSADPGERHDLSSRQPRTFVELLRRLQQATAPLAPLGAAAAGTVVAPPPAPAPDPELLERLEALGYVR